MSTHAATHDHDHHITPPSTLIANFLALGGLMGLTILAAKLDFGHLLPVSSQMGSVINNVVALLIAIVKAYLVVSIFMGVKWGTKLIKMWAFAGFVWLPLLLGVFLDYTTRAWEPTETWNKPPEIDGNRRLGDEAAFPSEVETGKPKPKPRAEGESH
jgi:caa(3)-type oxidase subunit IV